MKKFLILILIIFSFTGCATVKKKNNYKVSKHFTFYEATNSRTAKKYGVKNYPSRGDFKTIKYTAGRMEKIRNIVGQPLTINSWYRSPNLNRIIGGNRFLPTETGLQWISQ